MVRVVPRCEKLSDFFARRPLISINAKSRFGDLTWKTARADYVNPTPWVAFKQLARFVNDSDPLRQRVDSIFLRQEILDQLIRHLLVSVTRLDKDNQPLCCACFQVAF